MTDSQIVCALSGVSADADDYADTDDYDGAHKALPEGWTKIVVTTRQGNAAWEAVQEVKEITAAQLLSQVPEEARENVAPAVMLQIEAQFAALEARREYARTTVDTQTLYIAPPERVEGLVEEIEGLCTTLGIDPAMILGVEDEDPEDDDDEAEGDGDGDGDDAPAADGDEDGEAAE